MGVCVLLKSLEIQGFKTFPEKTLLSFNKGITTVVGPNGSGKSNISDAIRWVLGEQSAKALRCSKMEDIIFNGTPNKKPKGFAEVTLTLDNRDRKLPYDDEVAITRRFYRSGESEYLINKNSVRMKDIHELFMNTGLGKDGYSIIGQGKIDSIVASKSEDRREIFEEAAGISKYRYRKNEAEKKLEKAEENLVRLTDILSEIEARIGPLLEQSEKAKKFIELSEEHKKLQIGLWLFELENSNVLLKKEEEKLNLAKEQYSEIELAIDKIVTDSESILQKSRDYTLKIDETRREISKSEEMSIRKSGEISVLENDILHNEERIKRIKIDIENLSKSFNEMLIDYNNYSEKEKLLHESLTQKEQTLNEFSDKEKSVNKKEQGLSNELDKLQGNLKEVNDEISKAKVVVMTSDEAIRECHSKILGFEEKFQENENLKQNFEDEIKELEKAKKEVEDDLSEKKKQIELKHSNLGKISTELEKEKINLNELKLNYEGQIRKANLLESLENSLEGFAGSVKFIVKSGQKGELEGVCGAVSRLIKSPKEYSVAIETALASYMQNIVVDTQEQAKCAIRLLKEKKIGRATFLPVSVIKGQEISDKNFLSYNGYVGLASKLCTCEEKYKNILHYILGRILVVDNIDNASAIARDLSYKFKIVTLDGQVINAGGSLTGGAKVKNAGILNRVKDIEEAKNNAANLAEQVEKSKFRLKELFELERNNKEDYEKLKENFEAKKQEKVELEINLEKANLKLKNVVTENLNAKQEKIDLQEKLDALENKKRESQTHLDGLQEKVESLEKSKAQLQGEKEVLNQEKDVHKQSLYELNLEIFSIKKDIEQMENNKASIENRRTFNREKINEYENDISTLTLGNQEINDRIKSAKGEISNFKKSIEKLKSDVTLLSEEKMEFEKQITFLRNNERERNSQKEKISLEIAKLQDRKDSVQSNYDTIISKLWDEYELTRREALSLFSKAEPDQKSVKRLNELKSKIRNLGTVNVAAIEEYKEVSERYNFLKGQIDDIEKSKKELHKLIVSLTGQMKDLFSEKFKEINQNFDLVFKDLFSGGSAELIMTSPEDILSSGIDIKVKPPGKLLTHLELLSGGEKAFVSIALYFAIMKVNPAPFCVLDEIEAALDEANVNRFASYLRKMNDKTQFIAISHRRGTMEEADVLYGVTMQEEGISKLLELQVSQIGKNFMKE